MAKGLRNQGMVTNPPKRLPNQQDTYERLKPKPTGPGIISARVPRTRAVDRPAPADKRRHADGRNHKNPRAVPVTSTIANEPDEGQHSVPNRPKFAKGVPNNKNIKRGYYPPGAKIGKKKHIHTPDYNSPSTYSEECHSGYS